MIRSKLFQRQFVSMLLVALTFTVTLTVAILAKSRMGIQERELQIAASYRDTVTDSLRMWLDERADDVSMLAEDIEFAVGNGVPLGNVWTRFEQMTAAGTVFIDFLVIDRTGRVVVARNGPSTSTINLGDRDYVRIAFTGVPYISPPFSGRKSGSELFAISHPMTIGNDRFVLAGMVSLGNLSEIVRTLNLVDLGKAVLVDRNGAVLSSMGWDATRTGDSPQNLSGDVMHFIETGIPGSALYRDQRGGLVAGSWGYINRLSLALLVELNNDLAMKPLNDLLRFVGIISAITVVVLGFVSYLLSASLLRPIQTLVVAVNDIRNSAYRSPLEMKTGTELDDLIAAFNEMLAVVMDREASLKETAARDSLTGLYNHGKLEELLGREMRLKKRTGDPFCFVMLDIDHFKKVNDTWGHQAGDDALRHIAALMNTALREGDILGRYGGEEFAISLNAKTEEEVHNFCERIRSSVEAATFICDGHQLSITVSLGYVCTMATDSVPFDVVRRADRALYEAKNAGRNRTRAG